MIGLGQLREQREAAAVQRRRQQELLRRDRIFNARLRTIGVDKDALDVQVKERKLQEAIEKARDEKLANDMKRNDRLMCLLEEQQKNEIKDLNKALREFQKNQTPETRREFDLNDPEALKKDRPARVSDTDPRCTVSSMQKFAGEDLNYEQRMKFQKEQLREWSLQQQKDWKTALADQKLADDLYDKYRVEIDQKIMEEQRKEEESRRAVCTATKDFNRIQADELAYKKELDKFQTLRENMDEITSLLRGDFLSENPDQALSPQGNHVLVDRWKGMSQEQLMAIRHCQKEQILENLRMKELERQRDAEWDRQRVQAARAQLLLEREQQRQDRERRRDLDFMNAGLSQEQRAKKGWVSVEPPVSGGAGLSYHDTNGAFPLGVTEPDDSLTNHWMCLLGSCCVCPNGKGYAAEENQTQEYLPQRRRVFQYPNSPVLRAV